MWPPQARLLGRLRHDCELLAENLVAAAVAPALAVGCIVSVSSLLNSHSSGSHDGASAFRGGSSMLRNHGGSRDAAKDGGKV